ncbi:MAG: NAD(P)H-dependent oxidoreductase subunit E [Thermoplasmatota archaeon]
MEGAGGGAAGRGGAPLAGVAVAKAEATGGAPETGVEPGGSPETVGAVLVVGGGIGGMQTALSLADSGFRVYLVEERPAIGGTMAQLDKTFPTNDCAMCTLAPRLVGTARARNITLLTHSDVRSIEGRPGSFRVRVLKRPRYVDTEKCTGCGTCTQSCPVHNIPRLPGARPSGPGLPAETLEMCDRILARYPERRGALVPILQDINAELRYLPEGVLRHVSERLGIPLSSVYHVATFFTAFSLKPRGRHIIRVCLGTACHVRGSRRVLEAIQRILGISPGETTPDGAFTLETVNCLGACALGPVVVVDDSYHSMSPGKVGALINELAGPAGSGAGPEGGGGG